MNAHTMRRLGEVVTRPGRQMQLPVKLYLLVLDAVQKNLILQPVFCALECLVFAAFAQRLAVDFRLFAALSFE